MATTNDNLFSTEIYHDTDYNDRTEHDLYRQMVLAYGDYDTIDIHEPSISDNLKVGLFSLDHASQTEVTDIVNLKQMSKIMQAVHQELADVRKDIHVTKHIMQADHETKFQAKSMELYCRINEKMMDLEKAYRDRIHCLRCAFRQQLVDAVAKLSVHFNNNLKSKMVRERTKQSSALESKEKKFKQMQATILRNEGLIQMLQAQLRQYQIHQLDDADRVLELSFSADEASEHQDTNQEELTIALENLQKSENKISDLEEMLTKRDTEIKSLNKQLESAKDQLQLNESFMEKLKNEQMEMMDSLAREKEAAKKLLGHQNDEMKRLLNEQVKLAREEGMKKMKDEAEKSANEDKNKIKLMANQIAQLEKQLTKFQDKAKPTSSTKPGAPSQISISSKKTSGSEEDLRNEIKRLQKELERNQLMWEKKIAILHQSMHALKDESYLRLTLQRQSAQLHKAALSYSNELPTAGQAPSTSLTRNIRHFREGQGQDNFISQTITVPESRGTSSFFHDENQIIKDNETYMIPAENELLVSALPRVKQECGDESRPSSQSHVPLLPSIVAK